MAKGFAGSEAVEIGVQIEKNGRDFYNALAVRSKDKKAGDIFRYLASEEEKHIAVFREILDSVEKYEPRGAFPEEYFAYMNALASEHVFTRKGAGEERAKSAKNDKEAVDMGIMAEQESIVFYEGMKEAVPEKDRKLINKLIREEQSHLVKLINLKKELIGR